MIVDRVKGNVGGYRVEVVILSGDGDPPYSWWADCPVSSSRCSRLSSGDKSKGSPKDALPMRKGRSSFISGRSTRGASDKSFW